MLHSFSGPVDYAEAALEMGFFIAFGGLVFRRGEEVSAEVARLTPLDRILTETDSPYLKPARSRAAQPAAQRGRDREVGPAARGTTAAAFGQALVDNFDRFVGASRPTG